MVSQKINGCVNNIQLILIFRRTEAQLRNAQQAVAEFLGRKRKMADGEEEKPKRLKKATSTALSTKKSTASARAVAKPSGIIKPFK
jgi:hypothetical protein